MMPATGVTGGSTTKPVIIEALAQRRAELASANQLTPERVAAEYALIGFADMADYVTWDRDGITLMPSSKLPEGATRVVSEITEIRTKEGITVKFKLADKRGALDSLCRMMGWNAPEKHDHRVAVVTLADIAKRRANEMLQISTVLDNE